MKMIYAEIDYKRVNDTRRKLADESLDYLKTALAAAASSITEKKNNIRKNYTLCCGCGSCKSTCPADAIEVKMNKDGFYEASIDNEKCISCGKCIKVCPYASNDFSKHITQGTIYSFKSESPDVLLKSASGGAAYHISQLMQRDGYSIVGCTYDVVQQKARHIVVDPDEKDGLSKFQGNKYMQSEFAPAADQVYRNKDKNYLIIGTPCQIAGIRNLLKGRTNVIYADLICHGVPTYFLYKKYQDFLNRKKLVTRLKKNLYYFSLEQDFCYAHGCYECPWRDRSAADLRVGDCRSKKIETDKDLDSIVVAITETGEKIIKQIQSDKCLEITSQQIEEYAIAYNGSNSREPLFWQEYVDSLSSIDIKFEDTYRKYVLPILRFRNINTRIKNALRLKK